MTVDLRHARHKPKYVSSAKKNFYQKNEELILIAIKPSKASTFIHPDKIQGPKYAIYSMLGTILATYPRLQKPALISIDTLRVLYISMSGTFTHYLCYFTFLL